MLLKSVTFAFASSSYGQTLKNGWLLNHGELALSGSTTGGDDRRKPMYQERFEMIFRVAQKITSSFDIPHILETIRDEAMTAVPKLREVCMVVTEPDVQNHFAPSQCGGESEEIRCQLCERGWPALPNDRAEESQWTCCVDQERDFKQLTQNSSEKGLTEALLPIYDGEVPVAFLDATAKKGDRIEENDLVLLKDLTELATNVIINARQHRKLAREKLALHRILEHLQPFVPATVQEIVQKNPKAPPMEKEDKDVSILFLDVEDYTLISDRLTRDSVNFIIEKYFSAFLDEIYAYAGDINETTGDGLMVIFKGKPEENAANAVKAALGIHRKTLEINKELSSVFEPIVVNIGINSGIASVGMSRFEGTAGTRMTFTATGPATNLASRIAGAARNGDILIGLETARRLKDKFPLVNRGIMIFKNVKDPVSVFSPDLSCGSRGYQPDGTPTKSNSTSVLCLS